MKLCRVSTLMVLIFLAGGCERLSGRFFDRPEPDFEALKQPDQPIARPNLAFVDTDAVLIVMDDGAQCVGPSRGQAALTGGWTGTLLECPYSYTYAVELAAGAPSGQIQLFEVLEPPLPADEDAIPFRPIARVLVTDAIGRVFRFETQAGF